MNLELEIIRRLHEGFKKVRAITSLISTTQFFGFDIDPFAVELAKVTLMLAKRLALAETQQSRFAAQRDLPLEFEKPLPLDNLDGNIVATDALFADWPNADAIIGNPPYQSKNKIQQEYGPAYLNRLRSRHPDVPGRADYCVYWFRRAHDALAPGGRAGLVGTNTIRQNYSREGGLDYIVANGGTLTEAVSTQVWSGDAVVHVSIVNWIKGEAPGPKKLFKQLGDDIDSPWEVAELPELSPSLSGRFDVTQAKTLRTNADSDTTHQGQTHGHRGFLLTPEEAQRFISEDQRNRDVLFPFLTADELLSNVPPAPDRYVIDFHPRDVLTAERHQSPFRHVEAAVLPARKEAAREEAARNAEALAADPEARVNRHHENFLKRWWLLSYPRADLMRRLASLKRYVACARVTKRPIFAFVSTTLHPNDALQVFTMDDDYSFGILQSAIHWEWFVERCSTLKGDFRYTSNTVYDSFPWPQSPTLPQVRRVADAALALRAQRQSLLDEHNLSLRELYRTLERPGEHPLKAAHLALDEAVRAAYGMKKRDTTLEFLFELNSQMFERESSMQPVVGPGLPPCVQDTAEFVSTDCIGLQT